MDDKGRASTPRPKMGVPLNSWRGGDCHQCDYVWMAVSRDRARHINTDSLSCCDTDGYGK